MNRKEMRAYIFNILESNKPLDQDKFHIMTSKFTHENLLEALHLLMLTSLEMVAEQNKREKAFAGLSLKYTGLKSDAAGAILKISDYNEKISAGGGQVSPYYELVAKEWNCLIAIIGEE